MARAANIAVSQWLTESHLLPWMAQAKCQWRQDLPWISNQKPNQNSIDAMAQICADCPVLKDCARHALYANHGRGVLGGFYAGVWLQWYTRNMARIDRSMRQRARYALRRQFAPEPPVNPPAPSSNGRIGRSKPVKF